MKLLIKILIGSIILVATAGLAVGLYFIFRKSDPDTSNTGSNPPNLNTNSPAENVSPQIPPLELVRPQVPAPKDGTFCNIIILDAGSSKTEIFIYEWKCRDNISIPEIKQVGNKKKSPGFSPKDDAKTTEYMTELLDIIKELFSKQARGIDKNTPIMLAATGGVRAFKDNEQKSLFGIIQNQLKDSGFLFSSKNWARPISGREEGVFLWIAINYLEKKFQNDSPSNLKTIVLDLGGASTQIAFETNKIQQLDGEFEDVGIKRSKTFSVFSKSFQDYGNDIAREGVQKLFKKNLGILQSSCLNSGVEEIKNPEFKIKNVVGLSNPDDCLLKIEEYLALNTDCTSNENLKCSIKGKQIPTIPAQNSIVAVTGFEKVMDFFNFIDKFTPQDLLDRSKQFCKLTYAEALKSKSGSENKYLSRMCFMGLYSAQLLMKAYLVEGNRIIHAKEKIDENDAGWAFGLAIDFVSDKQCDDETKSECKNIKAIYLEKPKEEGTIEEQTVVIDPQQIQQPARINQESNVPPALRRLRFRITNEKLT